LTLSQPDVTIGVREAQAAPVEPGASMKTLSLVLFAILLGCGQALNHNGSSLVSPGTLVITADQIEKSGASTAWQVLRQRAPMLAMREDRNGRPQSMGRRGRSSLVLDEAPMILLDGVRVPDFRSLDSIEAQSIAAIYIYDGVEGTTYFGTNAGTGVILIKTKDGRPT
jgi:outer membrane cobalamin receptor